MSKVVQISRGTNDRNVFLISVGENNGRLQSQPHFYCKLENILDIVELNT